LVPTHKRGTCAGYSSTLRRFHEWLDDAHIKPKQLTRDHVEQWLLALHDLDLAACTRMHAILQVRTYLRWRFERGELRRHPDDLIRTSDLPKLPAYLPRPLPPNVDLELQRRLGATDNENPLRRGLLLMRHTGLRAGELLALDYDCVRDDFDGNRFLKVPLGKLNNERLVPLSENAFRLVVGLQGVGCHPRQNLLVGGHKKKVTYENLRSELHAASAGIEDSAPITSHRLRHTYATTLLNGGMSLVGVMRLLGHRDFRMTLRYTAITQETVGREYFEALARLEGKYASKQLLTGPVGADLDPIKALTDLAAWIQKEVGHHKGQKNLARNLNKRVLRLRQDLQLAAGQ
jgi:site-specific recombinase XerD